MKKLLALVFALPLFVTACGGDGGSNSIAKGNYSLTSSNVEVTNNNGAGSGLQTLTVTGDYTWSVEKKGDNKYRVVATGTARFSFNNTTSGEWSCRGAQDVFSFNLSESGSVTSFRQVESGCPQSPSSLSSAQITIKVEDKDSFQVTIVESADGNRTITTLVFSK